MFALLFVYFRRCKNAHTHNQQLALAQLHSTHTGCHTLDDRLQYLVGARESCRCTLHIHKNRSHSPIQPLLFRCTFQLMHSRNTNTLRCEKRSPTNFAESKHSVFHFDTLKPSLWPAKVHWIICTVLCASWQHAKNQLHFNQSIGRSIATLHMRKANAVIKENHSKTSYGMHKENKSLSRQKKIETDGQVHEIILFFNGCDQIHETVTSDRFQFSHF